MPDEIPLPLPAGENTLPEITAEISSAAAAAPAENTFGEKIVSRVASVFQKHGVKYRAGRGRPRADGSPKASDVVLGKSAPSPAAASPAPARPADEQGFIRRVVKNCAKAIFSTADKFLKNFALLAGHDEAAAEKIIAANSITDAETDAYGELGLMLADYYKIKTEYFALGGAVVLIGGSVGRYALTALELKKQAAQRRKIENPPK